MKDDIMFIEVMGIEPEDIPVDEEHGHDFAWDISNDIYDLLHDEWDLDVEGVACVVNKDAHNKLIENR